MSNVYVFDPVLFKMVYPQFSTLSDEVLEYFFERAESQLDNSESSCIPLKERKILFNLLVAHYAELQNRIAEGNGGLVGNITSASEGSVSISVDTLKSTSSTGAWLNQTPYGAEYWILTAKYRVPLYIHGEESMPVERYGFWGFQNRKGW